MTSETGTVAAVGALLAAWRMLYPDEETGRRGDAGARAYLRRAGSPAEVELEPAFHDLLRRMKAAEFDFAAYRAADQKYRRLALLAGLLAGRRHTRSGNRRLMQVLGGQGDTADNKLKPLRFQALIGALDRGDETEIMTALRRVLLMAKDEEFNLSVFARDVLDWSEKSRRGWTFDYFGYPHNSDASTDTAIPSEETAA